MMALEVPFGNAENSKLPEWPRMRFLTDRQVYETPALAKFVADNQHVFLRDNDNFYWWFSPPDYVVDTNGSVQRPPPYRSAAVYETRR